MIILLFLAVPILVFLFSYFWVDRALVLTLASGHPAISKLDFMVNIGSANRDILAALYVFFVVALFILQCILMRVNRWSLKKLFFIFFITTFIFSFSYNFLSHDLFTYLFSAKMLWVYKLNPYLVAPEKLVPLDFSISFLRNVGNVYFYGVVSLLYSLLPIVLFSGDRILMNILFMRFLNGIIFFMTGILIIKTLDDKRVFGWWFFNPLLIFELLVNGHNDLLLICFFVMAVIFFRRKWKVIGVLFLLAAALSKSSSTVYELVIFLTGCIALYFYQKNNTIFFKLAILGLLGYLQLTIVPIQVWYYTWIYCFVPFAKLKTKTIAILGLLGVVLLLKYHLYIKTGVWLDDYFHTLQVLKLILIFAVFVIEFDPGRNLKKLVFVNKIGSMR